MLISRKYLISALTLLMIFSINLFSITKEYNDFTIIYQKQDERIEQILVKEIKLEILRMKKKYNIDINNFQVIIMDSENQFKKEFNSDFPNWAVAAAKYPSRKIIVKSPTFSKQYLPELRQTIIHEMIHIALEPLIKDKYFPRWINEGMAQYEAEQFDLQKKILLGRILLYSDYISLNKIDDILKFNSKKANLAYAQSVSAFKFLIEEFGDKSYKRFLILLNEDQKIETAFKNAYHFSLKEFESYWNIWAHKRYKFYVLIDVNSLIWIFLPILVLLAWVIVKIRNRKTLKRWEDDEFYEILNNEPEENKK
ncbi:MAG: peptidase MA family metallohydrolase [Candidatus Marinimicrobia bacterium]|nr:peptidase MA family metallohydrolase [Candidatus Neomarinimicrobiota bacterium]